MSDKIISCNDDLAESVPGGIAKIALDDQLTLIEATDTFYSLIANATLKMGDKAPMVLTKSVYSADVIYLTQQIATQRLRKDNKISLQFRVLQQNGSFRWIMISGNKMEELHTTNSKTVPVYACIAMDATYHMTKYRKIEQELGYQHIISELSMDIFFIYEIATDTIVFKEVFREIFGRDNVIKQFSTRLEKTELIYSMELPSIIKIYKSIMGGKKQARFQVHLFTKEGVLTPYVCYVSIIFDENKNPFRMIGKLVSNPLNKYMEKAYQPLQLDDQTMVYAKGMAEHRIKETLEKQAINTLSALMMFEIRNYKIVNEVMKNLNGEDVLTTIAGILKTRFRYSDVIGRLSDNEFIVFMKDMKEEQNAFDKAEQICKEVESLYSFEHFRNGLTISIGIGFTGTEQTDYETLLGKTKGALVLAKKTSASSYVVSK